MEKGQAKLRKSADPSIVKYIDSYAKSKLWQKLQNPKSRIANSKSEIQNPKICLRILDFRCANWKLAPNWTFPKCLTTRQFGRMFFLEMGADSKNRSFWKLGAADRTGASLFSSGDATRHLCRSILKCMACGKAKASAI